MVYAPTAHNKR